MAAAGRRNALEAALREAQQQRQQLDSSSSSTGEAVWRAEARLSSLSALLGRGRQALLHASRAQRALLQPTTQAEVAAAQWPHLLEVFAHAHLAAAVAEQLQQQQQQDQKPTTDYAQQVELGRAAATADLHRGPAGPPQAEEKEDARLDRLSALGCAGHATAAIEYANAAAAQLRKDAAPVPWAQVQLHVAQATLLLGGQSASEQAADVRAAASCVQEALASIARGAEAMPLAQAQATLAHAHLRLMRSAATPQAVSEAVERALAHAREAATLLARSSGSGRSADAASSQITIRPTSSLPRARRRELMAEFSCSLPAVLNDPTRARQLDLLTRDWGDGFVPTAPHTSKLLPTVSSKALAAIRKKYGAADAKRWRARVLLNHRVTPDAMPGEEGAGTDEDVTTLVIKAGVPEIYLREDFDLRQQYYFQQVIWPESEGSDIRASSHLRQSKLAYYLDLVEGHLTRQLAQRAERIFAAMSTHEALGRAVVDASMGVIALRKSVGQARQSLASSHLLTLQLLTRKQNAHRALSALETLRAVTSSQNSVQHLLAASDYVGALELIRTTQEIVATELQGVHALRHLTYQLDEIVNVITKMLESDFLSILLERIDSVGAAPDLSGTDAESKEEELAVLSERLQPLLQGLVQQNRTDILGVYWTQLETRLRSIIKDTVLGFLAEQSEKVGGAGAHPAAANGGGVSVGATTGSKTSQQLASWGDALRELNFDVWMALLDCIFARLLAVLQVQVESRDAVAKLLRALQTEMGGVDPGPPPVAGGSGGTTAKSTAVSAALRPSSPRKFVSVAESASESQLTSPTELSPHHHSEGNGSAALDAANVGDVNDALLMEGLRESDPAHLDADVGDVDLRELDEAPTSDRTDAGVASPTANSTASSAGAGSSKQRGTAAAATTTTATGTASTNQGRGAAAEGGARVQWSRIYADNNAVVERALEEVHQRCSKLIQARSRDGADTGLAASSFIVYFQKAHAFVRASETLCNASNALLRGTLLQQAKAFLDQFHTRQCEKLRMILNNEQWVPTEVPSECQLIVNQLGVEHGLQSRDISASKTSKKLYAGSEGFTAIGSLLMFVQMISDYCKCLSEMPALAQDMLRKLFELLRLFNNQINRLVLKAEAMQVVGLKRITAKQLGLASQTLVAVLALVPCIASRCAVVLSERQRLLLSEFDKVKEDYRRHRQDIVDKLVAIMRDVWARSHMDMPWHKAEATPGMRAVASSTAKLHKALMEVMSIKEIEIVFSAVSRMLNLRLAEAAEALQANRDKAALVGLAADVVYLEQQLAALPGVPLEPIRENLDRHGVVLPPRVLATVATATSGAGQR